MSASGNDGATMPALITTPSSRPSLVSASPNIETTSASTATSPCRAIARPPAARTSRNRFLGSGLVAQIIERDAPTLARAFERRCAADAARAAGDKNCFHRYLCLVYRG